MPEEFCRALRELMEHTPALERLRAIWARNAGTLTHLRKAWPDLKTVNGTHYSDVLEKLFEQRVERLARPRLEDRAQTLPCPSMHEEFKRRIKTQCMLPCAETACMLFWALLASGQITMRKVDGWQSLHVAPSTQTLDTSPHDQITSGQEMSPSAISTTFATRPSPTPAMLPYDWNPL